MAELNVQPKKKASILPWILLALGIIALIWFLTRDKDTTPDNSETTAAATAATTPSDSVGNARNSDWTGINMNAPGVQYEEVNNENINVRGTDTYGIYSLGENILFDEGKSTIRTDAESNLQEVLSSIKKRYDKGQVRVYGYTDAQGSAGANKDLAQQRADAVKNWLQRNGIEEGNISVNAIGEATPVASNTTEAGRQQNRRVEIVARKS